MPPLFRIERLHDERVLVQVDTRVQHRDAPSELAAFVLGVDSLFGTEHNRRIGARRTPRRNARRHERHGHEHRHDRDEHDRVTRRGGVQEGRHQPPKCKRRDNAEHDPEPDRTHALTHDELRHLR